MVNKIYLKVIKRRAELCSGENIGIFIDLDNIYYNLEDFGIRMTDTDYNIIPILWSIYDWNKVRCVKAYADYDQLKIKLRDLQKQRIQIRQVYGNGYGDDSRKNASDIELSLDALETLYKDNNIDTYVFVTADSDMIPIMSRMVYKNKKVHLYYFSSHISQSQNIIQYAHLAVDIVKLFTIDTRRKEAIYWRDKIIQVIREWHKSSKNQNKALGASFLRNELNEKLNISNSLIGESILILDKEKAVKKRKKIVAGKEHEEYYVD